MANLRTNLQDLLKTEGITTAVVVGRDGFVIDGVSSGGALDTEAVGAVISTGIGSAEVMGRELNVGLMTQSMFEYGEGVVVVSLAGDAILAIVASAKANLGMIRLAVKKALPEIAKSL